MGFNTDLMVEDMTAKGWLPTDLAKEAEVSDMTISRFLRGHTQTARTAGKIAAALGYTTRRYLLTGPELRTARRRDADRRARERRADERRATDRRGAKS